ncbi:hypothetical protein AVEN_140218-1 [Araneus ventricosus]|uniref:Uncharacterized protein n=1 Tax=Araneus ventricosus TaxID=182803 RepID=A0A4Y2I7C4_ARAVE|nr:hypothetical protein AVEN_140218-1 [Araneus ventricosus]
MLWDKIEQGINDNPLQERLLRETSRKLKTLQEIASDCKSAELSKDQPKAMNLDRQREVNAVKKEKERRFAEKKILNSVALIQKIISIFERNAI